MLTKDEAIALAREAGLRVDEGWFMALNERGRPIPDQPALLRLVELVEARAQAATLATVTPLVQMLVDGLEHHMLQTRPITVTEILLAEARAFLSGATKESTDHG